MSIAEAADMANSAAERILAAAPREGFTAHLPEKLPCNDAGLSFGQIIEAGLAP